MQTANVLVALGGDNRNTVPKNNVTPAEAAVLAAIHGEGAVHEIEVADEVDLDAAELREYLMKTYPAKDEDARLIVENVFPGRRPDFPETFADLGLPDGLYKATARATPAAAGYKKKGGKKTAPAEDIFETTEDPMG